MIKMKISLWIIAQCPYCNSTKRLMTQDKEEYCHCDENKAYTKEEEN